MKNITRIMGIVLTLALLAGMIMAAVPASAAELNWSNITIPNTTNYQITIASTVTAMAASPDGKTIFAWNNGTNSATTVKGLLKSTDGGVSWTSSGIGNGLIGNVAATGLKSIKVSPQFATDTNAVATDGVNLFRTVNGGSDWFIVTTGAPFADTNITSVDVSVYYNGGGPAILVGYGAGTAAPTTANGGVALYITYKGQWQYFSGTTTTGTTSGLGGLTNNSTAVDVYAVAFSPNYQSDTEILALAAGSSGTVLYAKIGDNAWNNDVAASVIHSGTTFFTTVYDTTKAQMAFPSDYDYTSTVANKIFLGFSTNGLGADMFRVRPAISGGTSQVNDTSAGLANPLSSIAYIGNSSSGTVVIADINGGFVNSTDAVTSNSPNWNNANTTPIVSATVGAYTAASTAPIMQYAGNSTASAPYLFCATGGSASAFYTSTDSSVFNAQSLISVGTASKTTTSSYKVVGTTSFLVIKDDESDTVVNGVYHNNITYYAFKSVNGSPWKVFWTYTTKDMETIAPIAPSPAFATDSTIYFTTGPDTNKDGTDKGQGAAGLGTSSTNMATIYKSTDAGATWTHFSAPGSITRIASFQAVDANNYFVSGYDKTDIFKNGTYTAITLDSNTVSLKGYNATFWIALTLQGGVYLSQDAGNTWTKLGTGSEFASSLKLKANVFANAATKTIYALQLNGAQFTVVKWVVGTSSSWENVNPAVLSDGVTSIIGSAQAVDAATGTTAFSITQPSLCSLTSNGILYLSGTVSQAANINGMSLVTTDEYLFRSVNLISDPTKLVFEPVAGTAKSSFGGIGTASSAAIIASKTSNILQLFTSEPSLATNGYSAKISTYTDTLVAGPETVAPKANAQVGTTPDFSWKAATTVGSPEYDVQIAYDSAFNSLYTPTNNQSLHVAGTILANVPVPAGEQLYWRVRVAPGKPLASQWSPAIAFTSAAVSVATAGLDINRGPAAGATGVSLTPVITWGTVPNSTYNFKISTDPAFGTAGVVDSKTGLAGTVYAPATALKANTNYFWEVQAVTNGITGDWVVSGFTTGSGNIVAPTSAAPAVTTTAAPAVAPTIIVTIPTQPVAPQTTPAYIWVIIAIGAILVIAVIVLIARTRRV